MFRGFGWPEILLILVIVLVIFGVGRLPQVGGAIGKSIREFRKARQGEDEKSKGVAKSAKKEAKGAKSS